MCRCGFIVLLSQRKITPSRKHALYCTIKDKLKKRFVGTVTQNVQFLNFFPGKKILRSNNLATPNHFLRNNTVGCGKGILLNYFMVVVYIFQHKVAFGSS